MSGLKIKQEWMQKTVVVWFGALLCCLLWGSAFPCIKIGYRLFEVDAADTASQIPFCRLQIYTGRSSGSWDWKCNGGTFFTSGEKSSKRKLSG